MKLNFQSKSFKFFCVFYSMIHAMMNAKGLYKTSSRSNTPVTTRGCSRVVTNLVAGHNVLEIVP